MKSLQKLPLVLAALAYSTVLGLARAEDPPPNETGRELLILRNGQILEGRVTKIKDHYLVDMPDGEIHVRAADADFVCRSLDEGYERKRAVIPPGNWRDHLELARWCFKHNLREHAAAELAVAEAASPNNPMVAVLKRQMEPEPAPKPATHPEKTAAPQEAVSNEELDRMVRNLPPGTVEAFTQTVQPVLMNNCTTAGCHGPQSTNNLRLFRVSTGQVANRRLTQRNLHTVLQYINRENPAQSPLMTIPAAPHGTAKKAIYSEHRSAQYTRLAQWVVGFSFTDPSTPAEMWANRDPSKSLPSEDSAAPPTSLEPRLLSQDAQKGKPLTAVKKTPGKLPDDDEAWGEITPASYQEPPTGFLQSARALPNKKSSASEPPRLSAIPNQKVKRGAPLPPKGPQDPFDPEVFNRRYHKANTPPEGETQVPEPNQQQNPQNGG